jgi:hypothetical protein
VGAGVKEAWEGRIYGGSDSSGGRAGRGGRGGDVGYDDYDDGDGDGDGDGLEDGRHRSLQAHGQDGQDRQRGGGYGQHRGTGAWGSESASSDATRAFAVRPILRGLVGSEEGRKGVRFATG